MKKIITIIALIAILSVGVFLLTGCGNNTANNSGKTNGGTNTTNNNTETNGGNQQQTTKEDKQQEKNSIDDKLAWPDNDFTKQVSKPEQSFSKKAMSDSTTCYIYPNWTVAQAKEYTNKLKEQGFVVSSTYTDTEDDYMIILKNTDGSYQVTVTADYLGGNLIISIPIDRR